MKKLLCGFLMMISISSFGQVSEYYQTCIKRLATDGDTPASNFRFHYEDKMKILWKTAGWKDEIVSVKHVYLEGNHWFVAVKSKRASTPFYAEYVESGLESAFLPIRQLLPKEFQQFADSLNTAYEKAEQAKIQKEQIEAARIQAEKEKNAPKQDSVLLLYWAPIATKLSKFLDDEIYPRFAATYNSGSPAVRKEIDAFKERNRTELLNPKVLTEYYRNLHRVFKISVEVYDPNNPDLQIIYDRCKQEIDYIIYTFITNINKMIDNGQ